MGTEHPLPESTHEKLGTDESVILSFIKEIREAEDRDRTTYIKDGNERQRFQNLFALIYLTCHRLLKTGQMLSRMRTKIDDFLTRRDYFSIEHQLDEISKELDSAIEKTNTTQSQLRNSRLPQINDANGAISWSVMQ